MEDIAGSAVAGLIAALAATAILGSAKSIRFVCLKHLDKKHIRNLVRQGMRRVLDSRGTFHQGMEVELSADVLRAAQYNLMIKQLRVALEHETPNLSHIERKELHEALDWYHTQSLNVTKDKQGHVQFPNLLPGNWPTTEMKAEFAESKFQRLSQIKWLKLYDLEIKDRLD